MYIFSQFETDRRVVATVQPRGRATGAVLAETDRRAVATPNSSAQRESHSGQPAHVTEVPGAAENRDRITGSSKLYI